MPAFDSQDFREGLAIGLALNGKIVQPDLNANIWRFAQDSLVMPDIFTLTDAASVTFPTMITRGVDDSISFSFVGISDDVTISFT
jgi:hypothetical protein